MFLRMFLVINTIVSNSAEHFIWSDLGFNCLYRSYIISNIHYRWRKSLKTYHDLQTFFARILFLQKMLKDMFAMLKVRDNKCTHISKWQSDFDILRGLFSQNYASAKFCKLKVRIYSTSILSSIYFKPGYFHTDPSSRGRVHKMLACVCQRVHQSWSVQCGCWRSSRL